MQWAANNSQDVSAGIAPLAGGQTAILDTNGNNVSFATGLSGNGGLAKAGSGVMTLNAANSYSGGTTVCAGTLTVGAGGSLGAATGPLVVNNPNTAAGTDVVLNLSTAAATTTGPLSGAIAVPASGANTVTINNGGQPFTVDQTADGTYAGVIAGSGSFTLGNLSTSTLTLSGANIYTGGTVVESGLLQLDRGDALPPGGTLPDGVTPAGEMLQINDPGGSGLQPPGVLLNNFLMSAGDLGYGSSSSPPAPAPTAMSPVPEPGSLLLLAAAAVLAAVAAGRRNAGR